MTRFEPGSFAVEGDHSANCTTITAKEKRLKLFLFTVVVRQVLVKSSFMGDQMFVKIGIGFNLSNSHPTECLNKILNEHNLPEWKREKFIAKFMNQFEDCFMKINKTNNLLYPK